MTQSAYRSLSLAALLLVALVGRARAAEPDISTAVEQSASLSMTDKLKFAEGAVGTTQGWVSALQALKDAALKDRALTDDERRALIACYDKVLTPLNAFLSTMHKSANEMQADMVAGDDAHVDLLFKQIAVVYKLAVAKQAESMVCTSNPDGATANGDQVTSLDGPPDSNTAVTDVVVPPTVVVTAN